MMSVVSVESNRRPVAVFSGYRVSVTGYPDLCRPAGIPAEPTCYRMQGGAREADRGQEVQACCH